MVRKHQQYFGPIGAEKRVKMMPRLRKEGIVEGVRKKRDSLVDSYVLE